jgi:hypothetical protein
MNEATEERYDPAAAAKDAQHHPRPSGVLPHHLRCDWMKGDRRCRLADNHSGQHEYQE